MEIVPAKVISLISGYQAPKTPYEEWQEKEGVPVYEGYYCPDVRTVPLGEWKRYGCKGAFINFAEQQETDVMILEIPPGGSTKPLSHLFETIICIVSGRGAATVWQRGSNKKHSFEWNEWSLFSPPLNCYYQLFNVSKDEPTRLIASNTAPHTINLYHNIDFVFDNPFVFKDRFSDEEDYFAGKFEEIKGSWSPGPSLKTNFIADVRNFASLGNHPLAVSGGHINIGISHNSLCAHISEWPVGIYQKAHCHGAGAAIMIIVGKGYSLLWFKGDKVLQKADWTVGSMFSPAENMYHQHFNINKELSRDLALRWGTPEFRNYRYRYKGGLPYDVIEYKDEDPGIRELFEKELAKEGVKSCMP